MTLATSSHPVECAFVEQWLFDSALPFWTDRGIDSNGLAYEELTFDGSPKELGYRRSLVQFRQVYVLARAALVGIGSLRVPCELFHRAAEAAWHEDGGFVHRLGTHGLAGDATRDSYDQAFALLASAWVYAIDRRPDTLAFAYRTLAFLDDHLASPFGGYLEATNTRLPRRQNPHMHLLEAFLALYEVTGDPLFRSRATMIVELLERRFVGATGALHEYFDETWTVAEGPTGEIVEPGHHYEWVWLLHEYSRVTGEPLSPTANGLFDFATRFGLDDSGRPLERIDSRGRPQRHSVKLWAVTEQIKAHIARAEFEGAGFDPAICSMIQDLNTNFLLHDPPLWFEQIDSDGTPSHRRMPASTLYHIMLAGSELLRWQRAQPSPLCSVIHR